MSNISQSIKSLNPSTVNSKNCLNNAVPDILKPNCRMFQETQGIETSLLDPVVSRKDYIRWTLDKKGILHSNSKIKFSLKKIAGDGRAFLPMPVGAKSYIKKCVLRCGTTILDQTENFNSLASYKNTFLDTEQVLRKEVYKSGLNTAIKAVKVPNMNGSGVADGTEVTSEITYDTGRDFILSLGTTGTNPEADDKVVTRVKEVANIQTLTDYVIDLHDMFNSLRFTQIPLYMCEQDVVIELFLETSGAKTYCNNSESVQVLPDFEVDTASPVLIADYIFYDSATMDSFKNSNSNLQLPFMEHKLVNTTQNYNTKPDFVRNLGGASKQINTISIIHTDLNTDSSGSLNNRYFSDIAGVSGDSLELNVKINDRFLYPIDLKNPMEQYVATFMAEGLPMNISGRDYMKTQGVDFTDRNLIEGYDQDDTLEGQKRFICLRNITAERINNRGAELYIKNNSAVAATDKDYNQLVFLELAKTLILKDGRWAEVYE